MPPVKENIAEAVQGPPPERDRKRIAAQRVNIPMPPTMASPLALARDEPAENLEDSRLALRERPDGSDDETSVPPRNPRIPPAPAEVPWPTLKPVPPTYQPEEDGPSGTGSTQGRGLRERPDAGDDETSIPLRSPRFPPASAEEPWHTLKPVPPKNQPEEDSTSTLGRGPVRPSGTGSTEEALSASQPVLTREEFAEAQC